MPTPRGRNGGRPPTTQNEIYTKLQELGTATDEQLAEAFGRDVHTYRLGLMRNGLVRQAGSTRIETERNIKVWEAVAPADAQYERERVAAQKRRNEAAQRRRALQRATVQQKAEIVAQLVAEDAVYEHLVSRDSDMDRESRRRLRDLRAAYKRKERENTERLRAAERNQSPEVAFLHVRAKLFEYETIVTGLLSYIETDLMRDDATIPPNYWDGVYESLRDVGKVATDTRDRLEQHHRRQAGEEWNEVEEGASTIPCPACDGTGHVAQGVETVDADAEFIDEELLLTPGRRPR